MRTALLYAVLWVPIILLGGLASFATLSVVNLFDLRYLPNWILMALNLLPSFGVGFAGYHVVAKREHARLQRSRGLQSPEPSRGFSHELISTRTVPLYLMAALLAGIILWNLSDPGFGLIAQLFDWPLATTVGGILGERRGWRDGA